jgi:hypothetical protein
MNTTKSLLIAALLSTTALMSFAQSPAVAVPAAEAIKAPAEASSTPMHHHKHHRHHKHHAKSAAAPAAEASAAK